MIRLCPLRSGSQGNAVLVFTENTKLLIDCGISGKAVMSALDEIGIEPESLNAVLVTHEHIDHCRGIGILSRKLDIPIYANNGTWYGIETSPSLKLGKLREDNIKIFPTGKEFEIGDIGIKSFEIPHDANEPVGYSFRYGSEKVAVATDMGKIEESVYDEIKESSVILLESNYDLNMLDIGGYPISLKRRIKSDIGHLCNDMAGELASRLVRSGTKQIVLGHLSGENNHPSVAFQTVKSILESDGIVLDTDMRLSVASRTETGAVYSA